MCTQYSVILFFKKNCYFANTAPKTGKNRKQSFCNRSSWLCVCVFTMVTMMILQICMPNWLKEIHHITNDRKQMLAICKKKISIIY